MPILGSSGKGHAWETDYETALRELEEELPLESRQGSIGQRIQSIRELFPPTQKLLDKGYHVQTYLARVDYNTLRMLAEQMRKNPEKFKEHSPGDILDLNEMEYNPYLRSWTMSQIKEFKKRITLRAQEK